MGNKTVTINQRKKIALVAHDNMKVDLLEWAKFNRILLLQHVLFATGTTGKMLEKELNAKITKLQSGPLGGDQQMERRSRKEPSIFSSSSGIHSNPFLMILT